MTQLINYYKKITKKVLIWEPFLINLHKNIREMSKEIAVLGAGCFWCVEGIFNSINGVESAISGFTGGDVDNPTYRQVCDTDTKHA